MLAERKPDLALPPIDECEHENEPAWDVCIVGAGLGGLAAGIFLARQKLRVVCVEPETFPHARLGESIDWSGPGMLRALGLSCEQLVEQEMATMKIGIRIETPDRPAWDAQPAPWFARKPLAFEVRTVNVDRARFDQRLFEMAQDAGVAFVWERVRTIEADGDRVVACQTAGDRRLNARWFIDASGQARIFAKALGVPKVDYGARKVCLWTYFETAPYNDRTTIFGDTNDEYLTWIWDIPITKDVTSVGCVMAAERLKEFRKNGTPLGESLRAELARYERFAPLLASQPELKVATVSYRSYVHTRTCGPNWLMVGEAASLPDPATANGFTAALRHAQDASKLIAGSFERGSLSKRQRVVYDTNVRRMGHVFNFCIETVVYQWPVRRGLGGFVAQRVYTAFSYVINALYSKLRPESRVSMALFGLLLRGVWLWMVVWAAVGRLAFLARRLFARGRRVAPRPVTSPRRD